MPFKFREVEFPSRRQFFKATSRFKEDLTPELKNIGRTLTLLKRNVRAMEGGKFRRPWSKITPQDRAELTVRMSSLLNTLHLQLDDWKPLDSESLQQKTQLLGALTDKKIISFRQNIDWLQQPALSTAPPMYVSEQQLQAPMPPMHPAPPPHSMPLAYPPTAADPAPHTYSAPSGNSRDTHLIQGKGELPYIDITNTPLFHSLSVSNGAVALAARLWKSPAAEALRDDLRSSLSQDSEVRSSSQLEPQISSFAAPSTQRSPSPLPELSAAQNSAGGDYLTWLRRSSMENERSLRTSGSTADDDRSSIVSGSATYDDRSSRISPATTGDDRSTKPFVSTTQDSPIDIDFGALNRTDFSAISNLARPGPSVVSAAAGQRPIAAVSNHEEVATSRSSVASKDSAEDFDHHSRYTSSQTLIQDDQKSMSSFYMDEGVSAKKLSVPASERDSIVSKDRVRSEQNGSSLERSSVSRPFSWQEPNARAFSDTRSLLSDRTGFSPSTANPSASMADGNRPPSSIPNGRQRR